MRRKYRRRRCTAATMPSLKPEGCTITALERSNVFVEFNGEQKGTGSELVSGKGTNIS
jgi:hypothetical protein